MSMAGGYAGHTGDYSTGAAQVIMPYVVGSVEVYEQQTTWPMVLEHSQVVVLWGMNPLNTLKIAWSSTDEQGIEYFNLLKKSGKSVIAIDPMRSETIEFFGDNATWIAPHMGTDVAMMLGIAHTLVKKIFTTKPSWKNTPPDIRSLKSTCSARATKLRKPPSGHLACVACLLSNWKSWRKFSPATKPCSWQAGGFSVSNTVSKNTGCW